MQPYEHLTLGERESLYLLRKDGKSIRAIARELARSPSCISRELRRNLDRNGRYHPINATMHYIRRRKKCTRTPRYQGESELKAFTIACLLKFWPPETICAIWNREHPHDRLGHTTIYRAIKRQRLPSITQEQHLRRRGKLKYKHRNCASVKADRRIAEWPAQVVARLRVGDWEGDTIRGAPGKGGILTLVDRRSRYLVARLCPSKQAVATRKAIIAALRGKPVHSVSFDNGAEFCDYHAVEQALKTRIYFADPHCPWQRGTNENTNGMLRFFFPKGSDLRHVSAHYLESVVHLLNDRPRKCLGWLSPAQVFSSKCCS